MVGKCGGSDGVGVVPFFPVERRDDVGAEGEDGAIAEDVGDEGLPDIGVGLS